MTDNTQPTKPVFKRYEGEDAHPEMEPNVSVKLTAVDYAIKEAEEDSKAGLPPRQDDESWKKRYGDLRSYSQKKEDKYKSDLKKYEEHIQALEANLQQAKKATGGFIPISEEEFSQWAKENQDAYRIIRSIASKEKEEEIDQLKNELDAMKAEFGEEKAEAAKKLLEARHPDMYDLSNTKEFWEWIDSKPKWYREALTNSFNVDEADEVLKVYKLDTGLSSSKSKPVKKSDNRLAAAMDVSTPSSGPQIEPNRQYIFKESDIQAMKDHEYEKLEPEITKAYHEGKVMLDVTNRTRAFSNR